VRSFSGFLENRLKEDGLGGPMDVAVKPPGDGPVDTDQDAQMGRLVQLAKTAAKKYPEAVMALLDKLSNKDGELRSGLESLRGDMRRTGNKDFTDKGLGDEGQEVVTPPYADMSSGGEA
jgi:hypothetical protein